MFFIIQLIVGALVIGGVFAAVCNAVSSIAVEGIHRLVTFLNRF